MPAACLLSVVQVRVAAQKRAAVEDCVEFTLILRLDDRGRAGRVAVVQGTGNELGTGASTVTGVSVVSVVMPLVWGKARSSEVGLSRSEGQEKTGKAERKGSQCMPVAVPRRVRTDRGRGPLWSSL